MRYSVAADVWIPIFKLGAISIQKYPEGNKQLSIKPKWIRNMRSKILDGSVSSREDHVNTDRIASFERI